jgi:hypothetical protein
VEGSGGGLIWRYYADISLEGVIKTTKHLSPYSQSSGGDLRPAPPEYEAEVLTARPQHSA